MKKLIVAMLMLSGCATTPFNGYHSGDTFCGRVGEVEVWNRSNSAMDCKDALALTEDANKQYPLTMPWAVYFTGGFAGFYMDRTFNTHATMGTTYTGDLDIVVSTANRWVIYHEFGHAWDTEHHLPNHRDSADLLPL